MDYNNFDLLVREAIADVTDNKFIPLSIVSDFDTQVGVRNTVRPLVEEYYQQGGVGKPDVRFTTLPNKSIQVTVYGYKYNNRNDENALKA